MDQGTAVDRERDPGDEIGLVGGKKQGRIRHVPGRSHLMAERNPRIAPGRVLGGTGRLDALHRRLLG